MNAKSFSGESGQTRTVVPRTSLWLVPPPIEDRLPEKLRQAATWYAERMHKDCILPILRAKSDDDAEGLVAELLPKHAELLLALSGILHTQFEPRDIEVHRRTAASMWDRPSASRRLGTDAPLLFESAERARLMLATLAQKAMRSDSARAQGVRVRLEAPQVIDDVFFVDFAVSIARAALYARGRQRRTPEFFRLLGHAAMERSRDAYGFVSGPLYLRPDEVAERELKS
ncbi:MAG: hypothetical protein WC969_15290 [Elusimicrobiota bacterium]|jgi:hypothetical protein